MYIQLRTGKLDATTPGVFVCVCVCVCVRGRGRGISDIDAMDVNWRK